MIGPIIAVVGSGSVALNAGVVGVEAAHTVADSFIEVSDRYVNMNNGTMPMNTTHTNSTLAEPTPLYRYAEVNGTGSTLPDSVYTQVPVYQDETTRGQPYENSHSSVCEGDCEAGEWTPKFLSEDMEARVVRDAVRSNRTTAPAPTVEELEKDLDIEVDEEDKDYYNYVEAAPKNSTEVIEQLMADEKTASQLHEMHGKGTSSTAIPSTTEDLLKSEKQLRKEYE